MLQAADLGTPNRTPQSIQFIAALHLSKRTALPLFHLETPPHGQAGRSAGYTLSPGPES